MLQRLIARQHVWVSLTRVVDGPTIGVAVTAQPAVPTPTPTTPLAEPLDVHLVPGGGVDQAVLGLAGDQRVLAFLAQRFLFLEQNIVMFGHSITFYNSNS